MLARARALLHPEPAGSLWLPYLGETLDAGVATLFAEEVIEGVRFAREQEPQIIHLGRAGDDGDRFTGSDLLVHGDKMKLNGPIDDIQLRAWGIQLVDGRMPGFAPSSAAPTPTRSPVKIVRELQEPRHPHLPHRQRQRAEHHPSARGRGRPARLRHVPGALRDRHHLGRLRPGLRQPRGALLRRRRRRALRANLRYNKNRIFAFVLALGEVDAQKYAAAAGAINYGFPVIADTDIPQILPTGVCTYEHVVSNVPRADDMVEKALEVRGCKVKITKVPIPVPYGPAFEGERIRKDDVHVEFGGNRTPRLRVRAHAADWTRSTTARSRSSAPTSTTCRAGRGAAAGHLGRGGRPQDADRLRAHPRAADPPPGQRRRGHLAHGPARHRLDARLQERLRQGLPPARTTARSCTPSSSPTTRPSWTR